MIHLLSLAVFFEFSGTFLTPVAAAEEDLSGLSPFSLNRRVRQVSIELDGTYTVDEEVTLKVQNETGRTLLGLWEVQYHPEISSLKVLGAYSKTKNRKNTTDLSKIQVRSVSDSAVGLENYEKLIIPFNNLKVGSTVTYRTRKVVKKPLVPGVAFLHFNYGARFPESNTHTTIKSKKPLKYAVYDNAEVLKVKQHGPFRLTVKVEKSVFSLRKLLNTSAVGTGEIPTVYVTTATDWSQISRPMSTQYEQAINSPLPEKFLNILKSAQSQKSEIDKIKNVLKGVIQLISYSGDWRDQYKMFFPKGHSMVAAEEKGDCKDYATTIVGILRKMGIKSNVALVLSSSPYNLNFKDIDSSKLIPSTLYFNHAVAYVKLKDGRELWIDGTRSAENVENIWPQLAGSPALILDEKISSLAIVPKSNSTEESLTMTRRVSDISASKAAWKGVFSLSGLGVYTLMEAQKKVGKEGFRKIMSATILGDMSSEESKPFLGKNAFNIKESKLHFKFDVVGENPYTEDIKKGGTLKVPMPLQVVNSLNVSKESDGYLGSSGRMETTSIFSNVQIVDPIDADCLTLSPWLDYQRTATNEGQNTKIIEQAHLKRERVSKDEINSDDFKHFMMDLRECVFHLRFKAYRPSKNPNKKIDEKLSTIRRLPIAKFPPEKVETLWKDILPHDFTYAHKKIVRLMELVLEEEPNNLLAKTLRAHSILRQGYISGDQHSLAYVEKAQSEYNSILNKDPNFAEARAKRAFLFLKQNKLDLALSDLTVAYNSDKDNPEYMGLMAIVYSKMKEEGLARKWLEAASVRAQTDIQKEDYTSHMQDVATSIKDYDMLLEARKLAAENNPKSAWAWHNLSLAYEKKKDYDKAIEASRKSLSLMEFGVGKKQMASVLNKKARKLIKGKAKRQIAVDRKIENLFIESNKFNSDLMSNYSYLTYIYIHRTDAEHESDWIDKADFYLAEGLKNDPKDKDLIRYSGVLKTMKKRLFEMFKSQGIHPSGRWPANMQQDTP